MRATVRAYHDAQPQWRHLRFETRVTLTADCPYVEVTSRILAKVPPQNDVHPADIKEGYWFSLAPSFQPTEIVRDYPLGVEATKKARVPCPDVRRSRGPGHGPAGAAQRHAVVPHE